MPASVIALLAAAAAAPVAPAAEAVRTEVAQPITATKIILVGDSTTAVGSGWGSAFCAERVTHGTACLNLARGGRSSSSYRAEGSWDLALGEMKVKGYRATYVLIQFGHNDQPGKPGRSTDLATQFPANLARYVAEARAAGAVPVLVTPLTRRMWKEGRLDRDLDPWAEAVRRVARETGTPLVDLNARSAAIVEAMGPSVGNLLAEVPPSAEIAAAAAIDRQSLPSSTGFPAPLSGQPALRVAHMNRPFDYTHLGERGAVLFATVVADELVRAVPEARRLILP
ncbi:rhamnogalacturonan acetylesterase [Novosphingobium sp. TH158]|uniref:rhamnogalacturonan acetylesterase n=1 Tax=Novosphingobium sp. TH158 TaxID=2067455 RepID=UPI000C7B581A|nr:rhamnogalacturonan acetylesterase [Novosphingobium sp. TH158]PLK25731.1 lysophospholipase [Novosphingobium sp. TH158]